MVPSRPLIAVLLITLIMTLSFRSLKYGLLAMISNVFSVLIAFGVLGAVGMNLRIGFVIPIAFGLVVGLYSASLRPQIASCCNEAHGV